MLLKTSTLIAPWTIVESNDKWYARVKTLSTLGEVLSKKVGPPTLASQSANSKQGKSKRSREGEKKRSR